MKWHPGEQKSESLHKHVHCKECTLYMYCTVYTTVRTWYDFNVFHQTIRVLRVLLWLWEPFPERVGHDGANPICANPTCANSVIRKYSTSIYTLIRKYSKYSIYTLISKYSIYTLIRKYSIYTLIRKYSIYTPSYVNKFTVNTVVNAVYTIGVNRAEISGPTRPAKFLFRPGPARPAINVL